MAVMANLGIVLRQMTAGRLGGITLDRTVKVWVYRLLAIGASYLLWDLSTGGLGLGWRAWPPVILASPSDTFASLSAYSASGLMGRDVTQTLLSALYGLVLAIVCGVVFGVGFAYVRIVGDTLEPIFSAVNSLPRLAIAPLLIVWFGLGIESKVALVWFTIVFIIYFNTYLGVRNLDPDLVRAVRVMGGNGYHLARMVLLPSVLSWIFAALRTSVAFSLAIAVTGEFVGSTAGIGYRLVIATGVLDTARVFAIIFLLMAIGFVLVQVTERVEKYLLRWRPEAIG